MKKVLLAVAMLSLCFGAITHARERLAVLPLTGSGVEESTLESVYRLLLSDIRQMKEYDVVPESEVIALLGDRSCSEAVCAAEIGKRANASRVMLGSLNKLGEKIIFQYDLIDVSTGGIVLSDDLTSARVEDLDQVTKRIAASVVQVTPADRTAEVGMVTEQESKEPTMRKANSSWGIGFGYIYPEKGYGDEQRIFAWDFKSLHEMRHFAVDALLGIRSGFALNVGCLYLPSLTDFSPYVGGGIGFHAIGRDHVEYEYSTTGRQEEKRGDGFELLLKGGLLAFRTYDFRVMVNVEYSITLNDYNDRAAVITIGVMRSGKRVFGIF